MSAKVREALEKLKRGDCWCEMGIGNPMVREHSPSCVAARAALEQDLREADDVDVLALTALVYADAVTLGADMAQYGQRTCEPDYRASQALVRLLERRGVLRPVVAAAEDR